MALKKLLRNLTAPTSELDLEKLRDFCEEHSGTTRINQVQPRVQTRIAGEISSVRIVPPRREGSPWLEVTVTDGTGSVIAMWTGRRRIPGVVPGKRLIISGRGAPTGPGGRLQFLNPEYELL